MMDHRFLLFSCACYSSIFSFSLRFVCQTLRDEFTHPYVIVVDCLHYSEDCEVPTGVLGRLSFLLPPGAKSNLAEVIVVHPNRWLKQTSKTFSRCVVVMIFMHLRSRASYVVSLMFCRCV